MMGFPDHGFAKPDATTPPGTYLQARIPRGGELPTQFDAARIQILRACAADEAAALDAGYFRRPLWISWIADVSEGEYSLLSTQGVATRRRTAASLRRALARYKLVECLKPSERELREWKQIYDNQIRQMPFGLNIIDKHFGFYSLSNLSMLAFQDADSRFVAGLLFEIGAGETLRVRFAAATPAGKKNDLTRCLYLIAADRAREFGCPILMLGTDPNLYGHVVQPGLCIFKARMGFHAVPAQLHDQSACNVDVVEKVVGPVGCHRQPLLFEYDPAENVSTGRHLGRQANKLRMVGINHARTDASSSVEDIVERWIQVGDLIA